MVWNEQHLQCWDKWKMETSWDVLKYIEIQWQWDMSNSTNSWKSICESLNETQKHVGY